MTQLLREAEQFTLGLDRIEKNENTFNDKGYATGGPIVSRMVWDAVENLAEVIEKEVARRVALPPKNSCQQDKAFIGLVAQYASIEPEPGDTLVAPQLGYRMLAATVWKSVCDHALGPEQMIRIDLKTDLGKLLEFQAENRYWKAQRRKLDYNEYKDFIGHLIMIDKQLNDHNSTLEQRVKRARGLYQEVRNGQIVKKRGKNTSKVLRIPSGLEWEPWDDRFREQGASELLDLLACPKSGPTGVTDLRPFQIVDSGSKSDAADRIVCREHFKNKLGFIKAGLSQYLLDYRPLIVPPLDYPEVEMIGKNNFNGGYHTEEVRRLAPLVRFGQGLCDTTPSTLAIQLVNKVQQTEWRLDPEQLEIVERISIEWEKTYDGIVRPRPWTREDLMNATGFAAELDEVRNRDAWKERAYVLKDRLMAKQELREDELQFIANYDANTAALRRLYREVAISGKQITTLVTALRRLKMEVKEPSLYYAWNMDYRGRFYPVISAVSPQGPPSERYTLELAKGQYLSDEGEVAALRAIGTAAIDSKVAVNDRIQWARDNMHIIRYIADGTNASIAEAGVYAEPLELLSLCRAWVKHENGEPWHKLVYMDQTNSGWGIVAALMNEKPGLIATNVCPSDYSKAPNDAYALARDCEIQMLTERFSELKGKWKPTGSDREAIIELLEDKKLGRAINKAFAKTAIYGSGIVSWMDDIEDVLLKAGITEADVPPKLRAKIAVVCERGFNESLSSVLSYNRGIKAMARQRLFDGVADDVVAEALRLANLRARKKEKGSDLSQGDMTKYLEVGRLVHQQSKHGLNFTAPDGMFVDLRRYIKYSEQFQTVFHGKPTMLITDTEALDIQKMLQGAAPAIIHNLDSLVLKCAYAACDYEVNLVHDSVGVHPNHMEDAAGSFRRGFWYATRPGYLEGIAKEWGVELMVDIGKDTTWREDPDSWVNMFN